MADILNIGTSALLAAQRGLDVTGHNIANVNTPSYSRQRVEQSARPMGLDTGGGVTVDLSRRLNDAILESRLVRSGSESARLSSFEGLAQRVDRLLSDSDTGLSGSLDSFFGSLSKLAADPGSTAVRQTALGQASELAGRFNSLHGELGALDSEIDQRLRLATSELNQRTESLAQLNQRIASAGAAPTADLLDARDQLVKDIAAQIGISTVQQDDGSLNVVASSGQPLVVGSRSLPLAVGSDPFRPDRLELAGAKQISGGSIGGLLDARRELVEPALQQLGRLALALGSEANRVQSQGSDLDGQPGAPLFAGLAGSVAQASSNTGSAQLSLGITDPAALGNGDYQLRYSGGAWQLSRSGSSEPLSLSGSGTAADPLRADGMSLVLSGTPAEGDQFRLAPAREAAATLSVALEDPRGLAAAGRYSARASLGNQGDARVASLLGTGTGSAGIPASIRFSNAGSYSINGGPEQAWNPGEAISGNGWTLNLGGSPAAGDQFDLGNTAAGSSDNRNALDLAGLGNRRLLDGGRSSLGNAHSSLVTQIGSSSQRASLARTAAEALQTQAQGERDSLSGVNLDEEAANLVRYQQAYAAAAQVIATANAAFESLLSAARS